MYNRSFSDVEVSSTGTLTPRSSASDPTLENKPRRRRQSDLRERETGLAMELRHSAPAPHAAVCGGPSVSVPPFLPPGAALGTTPVRGLTSSNQGKCAPPQTTKPIALRNFEFSPVHNSRKSSRLCDEVMKPPVALDERRGRQQIAQHPSDTEAARSESQPCSTQAGVFTTLQRLASWLFLLLVHQSIIQWAIRRFTGVLAVIYSRTEAIDGISVSLLWGAVCLTLPRRASRRGGVAPPVVASESNLDATTLHDVRRSIQRLEVKVTTLQTSQEEYSRELKSLEGVVGGLHYLVASSDGNSTNV